MPSRITHIPIGSIRQASSPIRSQCDTEDVASLAESIRRFGLLSPLLVRRLFAGEYELIAGQRRLMALKLLGYREAEAIVLAAYDGDCALISLVENIQRQELHFFEEAEACRRILDAQQIRQDELAAALGRSPSALANRLRLLRLEPGLRNFIRESGLSERHARALLKLSDAQQQFSLARIASRQDLSVRRLEEMIAQLLKPIPIQPAPPRFRDRRLVINAFKNTIKRLRDVGVKASSRIEHRGDSFDIIVTVRCEDTSSDTGSHKAKRPTA